MKPFKKFVFISSVLFIGFLASTTIASKGSNGIWMNGVCLNRVWMKGVCLNGVWMNGIRLNSLSTNGVNLNGMQDNGYNIDSQTQGLNFSTIGQQALKLKK